MRVSSVLLLTAALTTAAPAMAARVVTNGGFETGDFSGWTRSGGLGFSGVDGSDTHSGQFAAFFSPNQVGSIAQSIETFSARPYRLSFWLRHTVGTAVPVNGFSFSWDGQTIQGYSNFANFEYTLITATLVGGGTKELKFSFRDTRPTNFHIDDISLVRLVNGSPVPEPAAWALLLAGFGLTGASLRRRRSALA